MVDPRRYGMVNGWVEPKDRTKRAEYWLTCRSEDAAPGYDLGLPDRRIRYLWNGQDAWITGIVWNMPRMSCLHSNNGWRIEEAVA